MALHQVLKTLPLLVVTAAVGCLPETVDHRLEIAGNGGIVEPRVLPPPAGSPATPVCGAAFGKAPPPAPTSMPRSLQGPTVVSETPPAPISGGTMLTTADGSTVVAADPDRDQLYFVDAAGMSQRHTRALTAGDEPGRVVEDAAGRIHVVLRGARAIATLGRAADSAITRREVCAVPRGIAYDAARDQLHIACAEGKLVMLSAEPTLVMPARTLELGTDLRDVLVRGDQNS
jgi:hypothetical protein